MIAGEGFVFGWLEDFYDDGENGSLSSAFIFSECLLQLGDDLWWELVGAQFELGEDLIDDFGDGVSALLAKGGIFAGERFEISIEGAGIRSFGECVQDSRAELGIVDQLEQIQHGGRRA